MLEIIYMVQTYFTLQLQIFISNTTDHPVRCLETNCTLDIHTAI